MPFSEFRYTVMGQYPEGPEIDLADIHEMSILIADKNYDENFVLSVNSIKTY